MITTSLPSVATQKHCSITDYIPGAVHYIPMTHLFLIFLKKTYLFLAALGLHCCAGFFSTWGKRGFLCSSSVYELHIVLASLAVETGSGACGLQLFWWVGSAVVAPRLQSTGWIVAVHRLSCPVVCGIFPDQWWNPCLLHWRVDSLPLSHQGSFPPFVS